MNPAPRTMKMSPKTHEPSVQTLIPSTRKKTPARSGSAHSILRNRTLSGATRSRAVCMFPKVQATVEDSRAVAEIYVRSRQAAWRDLMDPTYLDALDVETEERSFWSVLAPADQDWRVLIAGDDRILGFVSFRLEPGGDQLGHVGALFVSPDRFGAGVGTAVLHAAADELCHEGATTAFLWTLADDARTVSFYENRGWRRDGARMTLDFDQPRVAVR